MPTEILTTFENTNDLFSEALSSFTEEQFNVVPFEGSWTAAQVCDHILKSQSMLVDLIFGNTKPTERDPHQKIEIVKKIFLDFSTRLQSPEMILPSNEVQEKQTIINNLTSITGKIVEAIDTLNLSETCTGFALPTVGEMTIAEWVYFTIYHTQRHTYQLKNIFQKLAAA